jgi:hypothetical protein
MRKQEFVSGNKEKSSQLVIDLGYDECLRWFEMTKEWKTKFDSYFDGSPKVYYENLVKNYTQNMRIIQEFLNLHVGETSFPLRIRARLPLDKAIINSSNSRASSLVGNGQSVLGPKNQG